ncbi:MAG: hypothetical protein IPK50_14560 [Fibrobacterota bacterium]|nr:hypothetical protein [Fibrobacterota bacterium]QQS03518.1 MAG: hypothetical protein IPK50_14560 [Fibrobacterota bacterium]
MAKPSLANILATRAIAIASLVTLCVLTSCAGPVGAMSEPANGSLGITSSRDYQQITASVFDADNKVVSQEAVDKLLSSGFRFDDTLKVALFKVKNAQTFRYDYYGYTATEEFLDMEQEYFSIVSDSLKMSKKVKWVKSIPSILTPKSIVLPNLREAAARLQANVLIIYSVQSDIFTDYKFFAKNEVKAYSTVEMIAFDTRTGIIPISEIKTAKNIQQQAREDANLSEAKKRAQKMAIIESLKNVVRQVRDQL